MSPSVWAKHAQTTKKQQQQLLLTLGYTARNRQLHHAGLSLHPFARSGGLPVHTSARGGVGRGMPRARPGDAAAAERDNKGEGSEIELWYTRPQRRGPRVTLTLLLVRLFFFFFPPLRCLRSLRSNPLNFRPPFTAPSTFPPAHVCRPQRRHLSSAALKDFSNKCRRRRWQNRRRERDERRGLHRGILRC